MCKILCKPTWLLMRQCPLKHKECPLKRQVVWQSRSLVWNSGSMDTRTALWRRVPSKDIGQQKMGPSPTTILQIYKQCVRPVFEYGIVSAITVSESVINKIERAQNSFIRLAVRLPKYVSARLYMRPPDFHM